VFVLAFVADSANSARAVIGGAFQGIGKTLGAGAAQLVELIKGDFERIDIIGKEWQKDMDAIYEDVINSADSFRRRLAEINERQEDKIFPKVDPPDVKPISQFDWDAWARASQPEPKTWRELFTPIEVDIKPFKKNLELMEVDYEKFSENVVSLTQHTAEAMQNTFSDLFFDAMKGEFKSLEDYTNAVFDAISRSVADILSKQLIEGLFGAAAGGGGGGGSGGGFFGAIGNWFAGLFHGGGVVGSAAVPVRMVNAGLFAGAPRLHDGLRPDEFPAILQRGETVLPKSGFGAGMRPVININLTTPTGNIPNESMSQLEHTVGRAVQRSMERNN
jgi:hypothetical protein